MQSNLYEALGIEPSSDTPAIRAGLRSVLRRFWAAPRDASGDSEEAVRFVALAAAILTDPSQRRAYDDAAMPSQLQNPWRALSPSNPPLDGAISLGLDAGAAQSLQETRRVEAGLLPTVPALARSLPEPSHWASAYVFAATALSLTLLVGVVLWVANSHLALLTGFGLAALAVGLSFGIAAKIQSEPPDQSAPSLSRLSIVKWRRESSIFMGTPAPQQDTAWIFRLRLMELTRSAAGFTTLENLGARVLARCADYALLTFLCFALLSAIGWLLLQTTSALTVLRSPLLFPTLIVLLGVIWDALWLSKYRITPGRWLVGAVVVSGVTETAYGDTPPGFRVIARRAWHHATSAMALGIAPLAAWFAKSRWTRLKQSEGSWEAQSDSVVLTRPTPLPLRAAAVAISMAALTLLFNQWSTDLVIAKNWLAHGWTTASKGVTELGAGFKKSSTSDLTNLPAPIPSAEPTAAPDNSEPKQAQTPAAPPPAPIKNAPPAATARPSAEDAQARAVQARRARIDAVSAQDARARQSGNYAGLQGACQRWTEDQPASAAAWRCLGLAKFQAGAGRDALPALRQALKLEPNDAEVESAILRTLRP
jgi:uncharacterized RDD family membrane protein YckC